MLITINRILTIGHSMEHFLQLLHQQQVQTVIDVRATPASRYFPTQPQQLRPHRCRQGSRVHLRRRNARRPAAAEGDLDAGGKGGLPGHGHDQRRYRGNRPGRDGKPEVRNRPHVQLEGAGGLPPQNSAGRNLHNFCLYVCNSLSSQPNPAPHHSLLERLMRRRASTPPIPVSRLPHPIIVLIAIQPISLILLNCRSCPESGLTRLTGL